MNEDENRKEIEKVKEEIQKKKDEIEQIKMELEKLNKKVDGEKGTEKPDELRGTVKEVSDLFDVTFNLLGFPGKMQNPNTVEGGFLGLINKLTELSEKSRGFKKEFDLAGKKGVIEFKMETGPLVGQTRLDGPHHSSIPGRKVRKPAEVHIPKTARQAEERDPIVDVREENDEIVVFIELPGAKEKDITVSLEEGKLQIGIAGKERRNFKEILLPKPVKKEGMKSEYKKGVLEVRLKKSALQKSRRK